MAYPSFSGRTAPAIASGALDVAGAEVALASATQTVTIYSASIAAYYRYSTDDDWMPIPADTLVALPVGGGGAQVTVLQLKSASGTPTVTLDCSHIPRS